MFFVLNVYPVNNLSTLNKVLYLKKEGQPLYFHKLEAGPIVPSNLTSL